MEHLMAVCSHNEANKPNQHKHQVEKGKRRCVLSFRVGTVEESMRNVSTLTVLTRNNAAWVYQCPTLHHTSDYVRTTPSTVDLFSSNCVASRLPQCDVSKYHHDKAVMKLVGSQPCHCLVLSWEYQSETEISFGMPVLYLATALVIFTFCFAFGHDGSLCEVNPLLW